MGDSQLNIQWYPGHMTKAKREMQEKIKLCDLVIELRDARIPMASRNPMIQELCGNKPRLIILTKKDKADQEMSQKWINKLTSEQIKVIAIDLLHENFTKRIVGICQVMMKDMLEKRKRKGLRPRAIRAMVVGIPNVGKSTFINRLVKKKVATTGNKPGVTKSLQWIKVLDSMELLDTPGVLWPKFEDEHVGMLLALTGAIKDEILPMNEIAYWAMNKMIKEYPDKLMKRYDIEICDDVQVVFERIAYQKGMLKNSIMDEKRCIDAFIHDIRENRLGAITWENDHEM